MPKDSNDSPAWKASYLIKDKAIEKLLNLKDPHYFALLLVEFFLTILLTAGLILYIDGRFSQLETPFNLIIFGAILLAIIHFYGYTETFRVNRTDAIRRNSSLKIMSLEFIIFLILVFAAIIHQDQNINTLPYPYNLALFLAILSVPLYFLINEKFVKAQK